MKEHTMKNLIEVFGVLGIILLVIAGIVLFPLAVLWSVNTLVPIAAIPYGFLQWCAVIVLGAFTRGHVSTK